MSHLVLSDHHVRVSYSVPRRRPGWDLSEETMPESIPHDLAGSIRCSRGPSAHGGPYRLQTWVREGDEFFRTHAADAPAFSPLMKAWLVPSPDGRLLRIADDQDGTHLWPTAQEAALARVAELEAELRRR
ncbi:MAG: hypothetical protein IPJ34_19940 [Myxococcales bacterium]|nr:hypothetical protein [Myxococcales bacterium]